KPKPKYIGVTGTNGKTTTTYLVQSILKEAGYRCAVIGTLSGRLTTPSPWHLKRLGRRYQQRHYDWVVMEVSSHGIHQNRIKGIPYTVKALTNITQDHLDYHKTMEEYRRVKLDWFNSGDCHKVTFWNDEDRDQGPGTRDQEKSKIQNPKSSIQKNIVRAIHESPQQHQSFYEKNRQLAAEICRSIGIAEDVIQAGLSKAAQVPGRFEFVDYGQPYRIVIDYAHTPDGLVKVLEEASLLMGRDQVSGVRCRVSDEMPKPETRNQKPRLIVVFGCGGDRDHGKRPIMGQIAASMADVVIVTSDNPRSEDPGVIIEDILEGIKEGSGIREQGSDNTLKPELIVEVDRAVAIKRALEIAAGDDFVVLAGKGHETYQIFKDETIHFSDKEEVEKNLSTSE
ncbi:MAG: UDP-N-acetylmuramoyl-L-alanyl-D-glutamate--2,6-diaminopimelate ligase, partial [Candidatus Margulisiibacteriota bacterium]